MDIKKLEKENLNQSWVSTTGYRTLIVLKALIEKGCTVNELIDILKYSKITNKAISKDTVRVTINTLKKAGCKIERPSKANNYQYILLSHPFTLTFTKNEIDILIMLRERLAEDVPWHVMLNINELYYKFMLLTQNERQINNIEKSKPLRKINLELLAQISNPKLEGKKIQITYLSPLNGKEAIEVIPKKIIYENCKMYLWCYIFKYNTNTLLNIERISKINNINIYDSYDISNSYEVIYELTGNAYMIFSKKDYEEIININNSSIVVKAVVENEFLFIQRILLFGTDFKIISPDFFKEKLINKLKSIQKGYKNV